MRAFASFLVMSFYGINLSGAMLITSNQSTLEALKSHQVIPDVIPESLKFEPSTFPSAAFSKSDTSLRVTLGNKLAKKSTQSAPTLQFIPEPHDASCAAGSSSKPKYTICMTDPDAKSRETHEAAEFLHWLVTDITMPDKPDEDVDLKDAKELVEYMGPAPPEGTGPHRYVILLFRNDGGEGKELKTPKDRPHWGFEAEGDKRIGALRYAGENGLTLIGANFFFTEH